VVGGGIAGIQSALEIANAGFHVYLVEREPSIGGHMAQFDKTFPTLDCSACILTPRMVEAGTHPNITLLTWSEVVNVAGYVGNFNVTIKKKARFVNEELCTGCGICEEKCPKKVIDDVFEAGLGYRKAVYTPFAQAVPNFPVMDKENCTYFIKGTCKACEKFCPTHAIDFEQKDELINIEVGNIVLATGYDLFDARRVSNYGYGRLPNVFTSLEFERLSNAAGPTSGNIVLRDGKTVPKSVGIIHCVGSRDRNFNNYCSVICCMQGLKFAHLVHERTGATVYNFYIDMRTAYKAYDEFYQRVLEEGTLFVRGKVAEVTDAARYSNEKGKLIIQTEDTLAGKQTAHPCGHGHPFERIAAASRCQGGRQTVRHLLLDRRLVHRETPETRPGRHDDRRHLHRGCAQGPKDIPTSVAQGAAASARVLDKILQKEVALEPIKATVDQEKCSGCRICNGLCPFNAITFIEDRMVTEINPALCQGCGTCVAACPAGAISGTGFSDEQIMAQIDGLLFRTLEPVGV
jgi:heterodisulfide reductase subunit A2